MSVDETPEVVTAAVHVMTIPDVPPAWWFDEPLDVEIDGAVTVMDDGRVYGLLAPDGVAHRGITSRTVTVPLRNVDYSRFMSRETIVAGGGRVVTGVLTMDCGHAMIESSTQRAAEHYDNTCSLVASVRVGEWPGRGVWVAGALMPGIGPDKIVKMMSSAISGDWRPHRERQGWYELTGALLVPVPGFATERERASIMASGEVLEDESINIQVPIEFRQSGCGCGHPNPEPNSEDVTVKIDAVDNTQESLIAAAQFIAKTIGRDIPSRVKALQASVHGRDEGGQNVRLQ